MKKIMVNIDGKEMRAMLGQTILEVAQENEIDIPTLCYDERTEIYGSCGLCVCEVEGNPKMVKACATQIAPNMVIRTNTKKVLDLRKINLELLLTNHTGDCRPPCMLACPAGTDCQGYVGLIANGEYEEALKLIKDKIPLPGSIGRVCPRPCESACRRGLQDDPISIASLKRFAADTDRVASEKYMPQVLPATGKCIAIIGGGPGGLSAAFFLRKMGHDVTIFEQMPKLGGMIRYGIPEYRLPKQVVSSEVRDIEAMGVTIVANTRIGKDLSFEKVREGFDAVFVAIGAWKSAGLGCRGEDAVGVMGGIDFLRKVVKNQDLQLGEKIAIVGGGNTAMDACRTAVRFGAKEVYNIYRRTREEMPADKVEIEEAEEEGVIFKNLCNPIEVIKNENGRISKVVLQKMKLGELDKSGRRRPVPIEGETETLELDNIIVAIGQGVDPSGLNGLELTKNHGIIADENTFMTNLEGVFVGGDCFNDKITIAIEAIGHAKKAADVIHAYLSGEKIPYEQPYYVRKDDEEVKQSFEDDFEERERKFKCQMEQLSLIDRKDSFSEIITGFTPEDAKEEAKRCLECGCNDYFKCKLIKFSNEYKVKPDRFMGEVEKFEIDDSHPFIERDPNKCILCGLCVRVCDEVVGASALGLTERGFDATVKPTLDVPLTESGCISCGQCVSVCPTGALREKIYEVKSVPVATKHVQTTCAYCSIGCSLDLEYRGNMLVRANSINDSTVDRGRICGRGKFGFNLSVSGDKLKFPLVKKGESFEKVDYYDAFIYVAKKAQGISVKYGKDKVVVAVSDRYTNEEAYVIKKFADSMGAKTICLNSKKSGIKEVLGVDASPCSIDEMLVTDVILLIGFDLRDHPVIGLKLRQAVKNGARIALISPDNVPLLKDCEIVSQPPNELDFLKQIAKVLIDSGKQPQNAVGFEELKESLKDVVVSEKAKEIALLYMNAKKAMIVFSQNNMSVEGASMLANLAVISGHIAKPRSGLLQLKPKNNSQGLVDLGIVDGKEALEDAKALLVFGEDTDANLDNIEFLMVSDTHMTNTAAKADIIIPGTGFASTYGTFTNTEGRILPVRRAIKEDILYSNWRIAAAIANVFEIVMPYESGEDIITDMKSRMKSYKNTQIGKIYDDIIYYENGFAFEDVKARLKTVGDGPMFDQLKSTDHLMNQIKELLPKRVKR